MGTELLSNEFVMMKDTVWKLSSRVLLLEGFIKQQFGNVFWKFCEEQVQGGESGESDDEEDVKPSLPMPPMIPILKKGGGGGLGKKPIPPPPPLSLIKQGGGQAVKAPKSEYQSKARNFLPKSLKPKLPSSITITPTTSSHNNNRGGGGGGNGIPTPAGGVSILKEKIMEGNNLNHHHHQQQQHLQGGGGGGGEGDGAGGLGGGGRAKENANVIKRKSPALIKQNLRLSSGSGSSKNSISVRNSSLQQQPPPPPPPPPPHIKINEYVQEYGDFYQGESEESEEDHTEYYGADGAFLPADFVSATLCTPDEDEEDGEVSMGGVGGEEDLELLSHSKKMRLTSSSLAGGGGSSMNGGGGGGTGQRQMRPNPCHARCQNRCHDIWTDGDRMGVFQTYWAIPTEEERREFVASRIERVDMATKRTEFSNFRTCTFKYYLPHPDNPWVQVCKNFFLATIDEKRSYIEKIAQSVKGNAEKVSAKDIPFRRRNQMQRVAEMNAESYMGSWMTGLGIGGEQLDPEDQEGLDPQGYEGDDQDAEGTEEMGMEMVEGEAVQD